MTDKTPLETSKGYRSFVLILLTIVYGFNFIDRQIVGILAPYIIADLGLSKQQMGLLIGFFFALFYTVIAIPIAWLADRYSRVNILSIALATWSGFTALTGLATNFVQIGLARMGVGIGEAGGSPPSHSIISDLYPKEERAGALGIYSIGIPLGIMAAYFTTAALMGASNDEVNWRRIFVVLGLTGVGLAVFLKFAVKEPVRGGMELGQQGQVNKPPFLEALKALLNIPTWWFMALGIAFASFVSYAFSGFQMTYIRLIDPEFNVRTVVVTLGIINGTTYVAGTYIGAKLTDRWGAKDIRAYGWLPAMAIGISLPIAMTLLFATSVWVHLAFTTVLLFFLGMYLGPSFAIAQTLAPISMRAMSTALFFFILNMIALGGGPTFAGWLAHLFESSTTEVLAMRNALAFTALMFVPSVICFLIVAKTLPKDWREAELRNQNKA